MWTEYMQKIKFFIRFWMSIKQSLCEVFSSFSIIFSLRNFALDRYLNIAYDVTIVLRH